MFKKNSKEINFQKVNDTIDLASKVLKVTYFLLLALGFYLILLLFKESSSLQQSNE